MKIAESVARCNLIKQPQSNIYFFVERYVFYGHPHVSEIIFKLLGYILVQICEFI